MKVAVVGIGYVGLSNGILLAQKHEVVATDINFHRVDRLNQGISPIVDPDIENFLANEHLNFRATTDVRDALEDAELIIIATPTDYDVKTNRFDTKSIEIVLRQILSINVSAIIVIKSTLPVGYTDQLITSFSLDKLLFSPEFLREDRALYDNLYPSRIVVGGRKDIGEFVSSLLADSARKEDIPIVLTQPTEAEAIKLFSNTYLAMRVSFFNELDSFAAKNELNAERIIEGVCLDPRISHHYNNPSFGYGGYCLPKDTKQLLSNYSDVPQRLIEAIIESNSTRKDFIVDQIISLSPSKVGIFRLVMKHGSDNFRSSSILGVMERLKSRGIDMLLYEPEIEEKNFFQTRVEEDLNSFKTLCDVIICNRWSSELEDVREKVYTRDIFGRD